MKRTKQPWHSLYQTAAWARLRHAQLSAHPLCIMCLVTEDVTEAKVVDHVKAHKGDLSLFYDANNLQSLCKPCHDKHKQRMERGGKAFAIGVDGYPIELG